MNYDFHHIPRATSTGGGVGVILHKAFDVVFHDRHAFSSFEYSDLTIHSSTKHLRLVTVYRPPTSKKNKHSIADFCQEFSSFIEILQASNKLLLLVGDFNIHVDNEADANSRAFLELLDGVSFSNHACCPTHKAKHTLDLIITRGENQLVSNVTVSQSLPSDHSVVSCDLK